MALLLVFSFSAAILFLGMPTGHCADIVGGTVSVPHSRPYMAALFFQGYFCGGTLIRRNWVLSAAHCHMNVGGTVVLGAHSLSDANEKGKQKFRVIRTIRHRNYNWGEKANDIMLLKNLIRDRRTSTLIEVILGVHSLSKPQPGNQNFQITNVYIHPKFDETTNENDIMVLQLNRRAKLDRYVQPIQLPRTYEDVRVGTRCLVAGWGITENGGQAPDLLHEVHVSVVDRSICNDKNHYNANPVVTINMLCAGGVGNQRKDSCNGDSGGPLVCGGIQRGITSFGKLRKCGDPQYPGVYTRLTKDYVEWVKKVVYW